MQYKVFVLQAPGLGVGLAQPLQEPHPGPAHGPPSLLRREWVSGSGGAPATFPAAWGQITVQYRNCLLPWSISWPHIECEMYRQEWHQTDVIGWELCLSSWMFAGVSLQETRLGSLVLLDHLLLLLWRGEAGEEEALPQSGDVWGEEERGQAV